MKTGFSKVSDDSWFDLFIKEVVPAKRKYIISSL